MLQGGIKKKKNLVKKNEEDMEKGDGEDVEVVEEKVAKEFVPTSEMESMVEKDVKFEVNENAEEIDDWENFSGNEDEESHKKDLNLNLMSDNTKKDFNHFAESEEIVETKTDKKKRNKRNNSRRRRTNEPPLPSNLHSRPRRYRKNKNPRQAQTYQRPRGRSRGNNPTNRCHAFPHRKLQTPLNKSPKRISN